MSDIKNKTIKYQLIFIAISVVMALRCLGKGIVEDAFSTGAIVTYICLIIYVIIGNVLIRKADESRLEYIFILMLLFTIFAMSIFTAEDYIGSAETVVLTILITNVLCIIRGVNVTALILLPIMGMIISADYLFAYMGIVFILLIYKSMTDENGKRYRLTAVVNAITTVLMYVYYIISDYDFYFGTRAGYDKFPSLSVCVLRIVITTLLLTPYIIFFVILYRRIIREATGKLRTFYKLLPFGFILTVPLFFISNNYGTWFFAIIAYHLLVLLSLIMMNDKCVFEAFKHIIDTIKKDYKWLVILLLYAVFFTPIDSVKIGQFVNNFVTI